MMTLQPIPWGERDAELASGVRASMVKATPPTLIAWQPGQRNMRQWCHARHLTTEWDEPARHEHRTLYVTRGPSA